MSGGFIVRPPSPRVREVMTPGDDEQARPPARDPRKPTGSEAVDLVASVLEDAKRREEARSKKAEPVRRARQRVTAVSLPLAGAFSFYL